MTGYFPHRMRIHTVGGRKPDLAVITAMPISTTIYGMLRFTTLRFTM